MLYVRPLTQTIMVVAALFLLFTPRIATAQSQAFKNDYDRKYAVIYNYFGINDGDNTPSFVTQEQFSDHIDEITGNDYHLMRLEDVLTAFKKNIALPTKTIAISFDGANGSLLHMAAPILIKHKIPFTVFIPSGKEIRKGTEISWDDLRTLKDTGLVDFGIQPPAENALSSPTDEDIKREINKALSDIRKELGVNPTLFSYPRGEYTKNYKKIVKQMGFRAAFGQQSGIAYAKGDLYSLPRFTLTESFGDISRFVMAANALPLPVADVTPEDSYIKTSIGFSLDENLVPFIKSLRCFSSSTQKPKIQTINNRVEIRFINPITTRTRINCTLPVEQDDGSDVRWRWFGFLLAVPNGSEEDETSQSESDSTQENSFLLSQPVAE